MTMLTNTRTLRVFLASPGDLAPERRIAKEVIDKLNKTIVKYNWFIELLAWEDTLPGYGRPQEIINEEVDMCNLFVGLLWKRWGEPTGEHSSGFEEEFLRAKDRKSKSGEPEIWLYLKKIESDLLDDPGDQLNKVIKFHQSIKASREILYKEFFDEQDWQTKFHNHLFEYYLSLLHDSQAKELERIQDESSESPKLHLEPPPIKQDPIEIIGNENQEDLDGLLEDIKHVIAYSDLDMKGGGRIDFDVARAARLSLLSSSIISTITTNTLDTHEINLIYKYRKEFKLLSKELWQIHRTIISDKHNRFPGWFWFSDRSEETLPSVLINYAKSDLNANVRTQSIELLKHIDHLRNNEEVPQSSFLPNLLSADDESVVRRTLNYIVSTYCEEGELVLDEFIGREDWNYSSEGDNAKWKLRIIKDPNQAIQDINDSDIKISTDIITCLEEKLSQIKDDNLKSSFNHSSSSLRYFALNELIKRDTISVDDLQSLREDSSLLVRGKVFEFLIVNGEDINEEDLRESFKDESLRQSSSWPPFPKFKPVKIDDLIYKLYLTYEEDYLEEKIDWYSLGGDVAYKALITKFYKPQSGRLKSDIEHNFENIRERSIDGLRKQIGDSTDKFIEEYGESLDSFIRERFIAAALSFVVENPNKSYLEFVRNSLMSRSPDVTLQAVLAISRIGDLTDVPRLIELAESKYGLLQTESAKVAVLLNPRDEDLLIRFVSSKHGELVRIASKSIVDQISKIKFDVFEPLLWNENDLTREAVSYIAIVKLDKKSLEDLLDKYHNSGRYFYNVVCLIDRFLYSPENMKEYYIQQINNKLEL